VDKGIIFTNNMSEYQMRYTTDLKIVGRYQNISMGGVVCSLANSVHVHGDTRVLVFPPSHPYYSYIEFGAGDFGLLPEKLYKYQSGTSVTGYTKLYIESGTLIRNASSTKRHRLFTVFDGGTLDLVDMVLAQGLLTGQDTPYEGFTAEDELKYCGGLTPSNKCYGGLILVITKGNLFARSTHFVGGSAWSGGAIYAGDEVNIVLGSNSDYKPCSPYFGNNNFAKQPFIIFSDGVGFCRTGYKRGYDAIPDVHPWNTNTDCNITPAVIFQGNRAVSDTLLPLSQGGGIYAMNWKNLIWNPWNSHSERMKSKTKCKSAYRPMCKPSNTKCKPSMHKFQNNSATTSGGGLYVSSSSKNSDGWVKDVIENVVFERNRAGWSGKLIFCFSGQLQDPNGPDFSFSFVYS